MIIQFIAHFFGFIFTSRMIYFMLGIFSGGVLAVKYGVIANLMISISLILETVARTVFWW